MRGLFPWLSGLPLPYKLFGEEQPSKLLPLTSQEHRMPAGASVFMVGKGGHFRAGITGSLWVGC